jgi:hypothetical protein
MLAFGEMLRFLELKYLARDESTTLLEKSDLGIRSGFTPLVMYNGQRLDDPNIAEGLRISLDIFREMKKHCAERGIRFHVALIPTKENVFAEYLATGENVSNQETIKALIDNEREIDRRTKEFLEQNGIDYIEVLEPLRSAVPKQTIYPTNGDTHPNKNGYRIIAQTIVNRLRSAL